MDKLIKDMVLEGYVKKIKKEFVSKRYFMMKNMLIPSLIG